VEFHVFPHNVDDIETANGWRRRSWRRRSQGWVVGPEWQSTGEHVFSAIPSRFHASSVAVCGGQQRRRRRAVLRRVYAKTTWGVTGRRSGAERSATSGTMRTFAKRDGCTRRADATEEARGRICYCPSTVLWGQWRTHLDAGRPPADFRSNTSFNDGFNYFGSAARQEQGRGVALRRLQPRRAQRPRHARASLRPTSASIARKFRLHVATVPAPEFR
jgi:hypothetical protein